LVSYSNENFDLNFAPGTWEWIQDLRAFEFGSPEKLLPRVRGKVETQIRFMQGSRTRGLFWEDNRLGPLVAGKTDNGVWPLIYAIDEGLVEISVVPSNCVEVSIKFRETLSSALNST